MSKATVKLRAVVLLACALAVLAQVERDASAQQASLQASQASPQNEFTIKLPLGISQEVWSYFIPRDNPMTAAKVELGKKLFFDEQLSVDGRVSCANCHDPSLAFADGKKLAVGIATRQGTRNSPSLLNAMFNSGQFWDGRAETLEAQAKLPLINPDEMGNQSYDEVVRRLDADPEYKKLFREVFGGPVTIDRLAKAIAAYERTLVSANSPFDRFIAGDRSALTEAAQRGLILFRGKASCNRCHTINPAHPFLTDQNYRNTGVAANSAAFTSIVNRALEAARAGTSPALLDTLAKQPGASELGRFLVTGHSLDVAAFRTPSLRNVELTAPYFHDGSAATLADVIGFYVKGGNDNPYRDWELQPVMLSESEQQDLIEFLKALTSDDLRQAARSAALN